MKALCIILTGLGVVLASFTFLFFTLEDQTPYADPVPMWPIFLGVAMVILGLICYTRKT
jgi:hypothetical protein